MTIEKFLYRGVNIDMHLRGEGLKPKGIEFEREPQHGEDYVMHGNIQHGKSSLSSILAHQTDSTKFPSSGISTTPHFEIAKSYATFNNKNGVVYKIDPIRFQEFEIETFEVKDFVSFPNKPKDEEIILRHKLDKEISMKIVAEIIEVRP